MNLELASIYEKEKNFCNAEFIYNDLLENFSNDHEILKKLGYIYVMNNDLKKAFDTYEKIHKKKMADEEVINMLCEITYDLKNHKDSIKYINQYLKFKPRDVNKLNMKAVCLEANRDLKEAADIHKRILELQPYNTNSRDKLKEFSKYS
ncbi:MAG: hypothetical protein P1U46_02225 [Patescibacteria group bacterium]|nr:hypothetical protein [Patescibacteria group bacterium]